MKTRERKKLTTEMYLSALEKDEETISILTQRFGTVGALNTPEKRACFRTGYEAGWKAILGKHSNPDTPRERFHGWRALHPRQATDNDAYYAALGCNLSPK